MKKIALDLDGVVFDSENLYRVYTEIYDVDIFGKDSIIDNTKRIFQQRYDWSKEDFSKFYQENALHILTTSPIMTGADVVIKKLQNDFEFIVVTARSKEEVEIVQNSFEQLGIEDIRIFYDEHHKTERLLKEHVDYIIDDEPITCIDAAKNSIHALYFKNNAANKLEKTPYLKTVHNWGEIYKYLKLEDKN